MRAQCIQAVTQAIGRALTSQEVRDIEQRIAGAMRRLARQDPQGWMAKSKADRLTEAGQAAAAELVGEKQLKQQREALTVLALSRVDGYMQDAAARGIGPVEALQRVIAVHADGKSNIQSIESQADAIRADAIRQVLTTLEASHPKWFGLFENQEGIEAIIRELFGEHSGDADAAAGAKVYHEVAEQLRERFNRAGGDVGQLEDWGLPQHHSQLRVAKAGKEAWITEITPLLDRAHYVNPDGTPMNAGQLHDFLAEAWTTIATGGANKLNPGQAKGNGARANRGSQSRQIHFKDADSYMAYQKAFGEKSLYEVLVGHLASAAKDIALVETLGPNPDHAFRYLKDKITQEAKLADPTQVGAADHDAQRVENLYNEVAGKSQPVASEALARGFDTLRSWLVASRLGSAVITSFSDEATMRLTARLNNLPEMRLLANELAAFNKANRTEERMAQRAGLALNTLISTLNRFGNDSLKTGWVSKLAGATVRASGLAAMTEARRRAFGVTMMGAIGNVVKHAPDLAALDPVDHRILLSKGISDTDFAVWKQAQQENWGGGNDTMLTPESIYRIPDQKMAKIDPDPSQWASLKEQAATRLLGAVLEETNIAVIEPGARERVFTRNNLQRGTWKGELARSFFLFKSFPMAMMMRHWQRGMAQPTKGGRAAYMATLLAATTLMGMASLQVNEVLSGRDPRKMFGGEHWKRNWLAAMLKGGSLGLYGDFLFSENTQHGGGILSALEGPVFGMADDVLRLTQGNAVKAAQGKETNFGAEAVKMVRSNTPGASLWYTKAALDHLIFHQLQEYFSPGYLSQMRKRANREFGQQYWWEPGEVMPDRAPDFAGAVGE